MPLQFKNLRLSAKHEVTRNADEATSNWPEIFFWTEGLMLLNWVQVILRRLPSLAPKTQERFWKRIMPPQFLRDFARLAEFTPAQVVEYCRIRQSAERAGTRLIMKARAEYEKPRGADSEVSFGELWLDQKKFVLTEAAKFRQVNFYPELICKVFSKAAQENDVRFFIRLGKALQSKKRKPDVDWTRPGCSDPVACFLVNNWCEGRDYKSRLPALCFFSDQALANFCHVALGRSEGIPSLDTIRQWRRHLGLKQASTPKVKGVAISGSAILFTKGP